MIYEQFINFLIKLEKHKIFKQENEILEKHHILPLHDGGKKNGPVVFCTPSQHTLAHYYRYLSYGQRGDYVAFKMRWNQSIDPRERSLLAVETNKHKKNIFWSSDWQSEQGKKGGLIGGKRNTKKQKIARSRIGKIYGPKLGLNNQSFVLKTFLSKTTIWRYQFNGQIKKVTILQQKSFKALIDKLQKETLDPKTKITAASFYKIVHGQRHQLYGWQLWLIKLKN